MASSNDLPPLDTKNMPPLLPPTHVPDQYRNGTVNHYMHRQDTSSSLMPQQQSFSQHLVSSLEAFCEHTPLHGFQSIGLSDRHKRRRSIIWCIVLIVSVGLAVYQVANILDEFLKGNTAFSVTTVTKPDSLKFPDVIICDANPFYRPAYEKTGLTQPNETGARKLLQYLTWEWNVTTLLRKIANSPKVPQYINRLESIQKRAGNWTFSNLVESVGHPCTSMLHECNRGETIGGGLPVMFNCCAEAETAVYAHFGNCYIIPGHTQLSSEPVYGGFGALLSFKASLNRSNYLPLQIRTVGFYLGIAYKFESEYDSQLLSAREGTFVLFHLKPTKQLLLNTAQHPCAQDRTERLQTCKKSCEIKLIYQRCNCTPMILNRQEDELRLAPICEARQLVTCVRDFNNELLSAIEHCKTTCIPPCVRWEYQVTSSWLPSEQGVMPRPGAGANDPNMLASNGLENRANIQIFMTSLEHHVMTQFFTMTIDAMLGSMGGLFGIYLGGSVIAFIHVITTFFDVVRTGCSFYCNSPKRSKSRKQRKQRHKNQSQQFRLSPSPNHSLPNSARDTKHWLDNNNLERFNPNFSERTILEKM